MTIATTTLHSTKDGADKLYVPAIVSNPNGGFDVTAQSGQRGGTLVTQKPKVVGVDEDAARKAYAALVTKKIKSGGYRPLDADAIAVAVVSERDGKSAGVPVQLLNFATASEVAALIAQSWLIQKKMDGERRLVIANADGVFGVNRKGAIVPLPAPIVDAVKALGNDAILDGEIVGDVLHVFDAQRLHGEDVTAQGFLHRHNAMALLLCGQSDSLRIVYAFMPHSDDHTKMIERLRERGAEGVVLRHPGAPYTDGRPSKGGNAVKFKFYNTASFEVIRHNAQHSVGVAVYDGSERVDVGNVTLPPSLTAPAIGSVIEARYLYAYRGGSIYQPTFLAVRNDVGTDACTIDQLVYKGEGVAA